MPQAGLLVVGLGASAGGLEALQRFISHQPPDAGISFLVVQHHDPDHPTRLPELLGRQTEMPVSEAADGTRIEGGRIYVISPGTALEVADGRLRVSAPAEPRGHRAPIDLLFASLAAEYRHRAVCAVLSGAGSDGSVGLRAVKEAGGLTLAQSPGSAGFDSMPRSAAATGAVDLVVAPEEMPSRLLDHRRHLEELEAEPPGSAGAGPEVTGAALDRVVELLAIHTGRDFSGFKRTTFGRRVRRRM